MKFERLEENLVAKETIFKAVTKPDTEIQTDKGGTWTHDANDYTKPPVTQISVY